ncbi:hypothetical protein DRN73_02450 [Candidatus Pacearchaeota archaeon]|nr:MAG: hypothetical protein DRN73_02450 [Candidatus Pacearchaeota archaeon]
MIITILFISFISAQATNKNSKGFFSNVFSWIKNLFFKEKIPDDYFILIEGENAVLSGKGNYTYSGKSGRGSELYLGDKNVNASYIFNSSYSGKFQLYAFLADDGVHENGARDVNFFINGKKYKYSHISKNLTCGKSPYSWIYIADVKLKKGNNSILIIKPETTSAAFVMDKFEFTNQNLSKLQNCSVPIEEKNITENKTEESPVVPIQKPEKKFAENYKEYLQGMEVPYLNSCSEANKWFEGSNGKKVGCDSSFKKCYESCSKKKLYLVCDMMCLDSGYTSCYNSCSPVNLDSACDNKCD